MNVLIDTNVLLSAALRDKLPEQVVLYVATRDDFRWLVSPEILAEYNGVLRRPKFGLDQQVLKQWAELLAMRTVNIDSPPKVPDFPRDPKDAPFLAAAMAVRADYLITGDKDLLEAKDIVTTRIVTVAEFAGEFQIS
jgi:putative PIN family toxin of toxin-antitoxin system